MKCCKKKIIAFKNKVRKRLKQQRRELKARLDYCGRLNKENNDLVETNKKCVENMQSTINQKDKEITSLKLELDTAIEDIKKIKK